MFNYYGLHNKAEQIYKKYSSLIPVNDLYLKNKFLSEYEFASGKFILQSKPRNLYIELFDMCRMNCIMCNQKRKNYFLPEKYINEIFDLLPYLDTILWQGGEVFLWKNFLFLLKLISNYKRITQSVITNFQDVGEKEIKSLVKIANVKLILSIDGVTKNTYENIRKGSNFAKLVKNINLLNKYKQMYRSDTELHINFVILKENYHEIPDVIDFAAKYKFISVSFNECLNPLHYENGIDLKLKNEIDSILKLAAVKALKNNIKIVMQYPNRTLMKLKKRNISDKRMICKNPWYKLFIGTNYNFAPDCTCLKRKKYDDNSSILSMWNSEFMQDYRKHILDIKNNPLICNKKCLFYASDYLDGISVNDRGRDN